MIDKTRFFSACQETTDDTLLNIKSLFKIKDQINFNINDQI